MMQPQHLQNPFLLKKLLWPEVSFYRQQRDIIQSVWENDETYVPAGNMLGKDFVAGFICVAFFLTRHPCRVVNTSAKADHLRVLWGEINQFIQTSKIPLDEERGGPLRVLHQEIRKVYNGAVCPKSYVKGLVASPDTIAAMQGHHIANTGDGTPRTLFMSDESSSVPDDYYKLASTWFNRALIFGNTWDCRNYFWRGVKGGDVSAPGGDKYYRKVIRIRAEDSPNVRLGLLQKARGEVPTDEMLVPGVKSYSEYCKNRALWDEIQQCVSLDAEFYEGAGVRLFPELWLNRAKELQHVIVCLSSPALAIGVDPAEGGDKTAMVAINHLGVKDVRSRKTPDTNVVCGEVLAFMREHKVLPENVVFDRGGGGKQHADRLRAQGYNVRTVGFGEKPALELRRGLYQLQHRKDMQEEKYAYVDRRSEMYGDVRLLLDPTNTHGFAIPTEFASLHEQMSPIPLTYDDEGRMDLLPKRADDPSKPSLVQLIGHSPDELDALALAVYGMLHKRIQSHAGAIRTNGHQ